MKRRYAWSHESASGHQGGIKAERDSRIIAERSGWKQLDTGLHGPAWQRIPQLLFYITQILLIKRDSVFFVQLPVFGAGNILIAKLILKRFRSIALLHDIQRMRGRSGGSPEALIARSSGLISTGKLFENLDAPVKNIARVRLEAWDYLVAKNFTPPAWDPRGRILFAGSLSPAKVPWLYRADSGRPSLLLYGNEYDETGSYAFKDIYKGPFSADQPVISETVGWGLVWDGARVDHEPDSNIDYETINQPHKVSLYLACGLPLIVWERSFVADFVKRYRCGIVISTLAEILGALERLTEADCEVMRENALKLGEKVRGGQFLWQALSAIELNCFGNVPNDDKIKTRGMKKIVSGFAS